MTVDVSSQMAPDLRNLSTKLAYGAQKLLQSFGKITLQQVYSGGTWRVPSLCANNYMIPP